MFIYIKRYSLVQHIINEISSEKFSSKRMFGIHHISGRVMTRGVKVAVTNYIPLCVMYLCVWGI